MAKYHLFWKFLAKKKNCSEINGKLPLFPELEFQKLEFLISSATVALLSWICAIKKNYVVLELGKLEYHSHNTRVYQARVLFINKMQKKKKKKKKFTQYSSLVYSSIV